jgi:CO/xanthine dehydrogenase FAD-binding subunit
MKTVEDIDCAFPKTLSEALKLLAKDETRGRVLAGGTDLMAQWASAVLPIPERAVDVSGLPELKGIRETDDTVVIGAAVTHAEIRSSALVQRHLPSLAQAAATIGGAQIQTRGTIGGSVANASPAGDLAPSLLISGGCVVAASVAGERHAELVKFFIGYRKIDLHPDELIVRVVLPKLPPGHHESFRKLGPRAAQAISKVMGSYRGAMNDEGVVRAFAVALGSVAPIPIRLPEFEKWIVGKKIGKRVLDEAEQRVAALVKPIDDIRSTTEYRRWVSGRLVRGFLEELLDR